ncbi:MAG: TlyA family RNA methyltransferase [Nitrospirae bacterium]|nr:TlyA family RNA methyltransferase [Nitrospirota bacterium]
MPKIRLDKLLLEKGLIESREKGRALILAGKVFVNGMRVDKAGAIVKDDASIEILQKMPYVSRGGLKLEEAVRGFNIDVTDKVAMDVGASTGGFTDCLLKHGAKKVYAIDVGYGQLALELRNDPRVIFLEKTNIRYLDEIIRACGSSQEIEDLIKRNIDIATVDVSFISLLKVIPKIMEFVKEDGEIIALIKPQFEAERRVLKKGVVRDDAKRLEVVENIKSGVNAMGLEVKGVVQSPIKGPKGNIEYFIYLKKPHS